nr:glycosyltransferase family 2 protein [Pseudomonas oleovorans]
MNIAIVLNYKAIAETVVCVESLLIHCGRIDHIVVVDNFSEDGSAEIFRAWQKEKGKGRVTLLVNSQNSGYAGGNNLGIRWALDNFQVKYFWIVNNDAYVDSDAFSPMLSSLEVNDKQFVGSIILGARDGKVECYGGGKLYPLLGKAKLLGKGQTLDAVRQLCKKPDYLMGCSLAFSASMIRWVGLLDEEYFMYSEEVDWQYQAKRVGISIRVVPESYLFHVGSLGSGGRTAFYHYHRNRAAIRFNKRFYGIFFAFVSACILSIITVFQEFKKPSLVLSGVRGAFRGVMMSVK